VGLNMSGTRDSGKSSRALFALDGAGDHPPSRFSPREEEIMRLSALDSSDKEIAGVLSISPHTLRAHISRLYLRLGVRSRAAAVALWMLAGQPRLS
jgi:LuxR family maltose regulon positive regulatory protein/two-component system response regulator NreC